MGTCVRIVENGCVASGGRVVFGTGTCVHWLATMTEKTLVVGTPLKGCLSPTLFNTPAFLSRRILERQTRLTQFIRLSAKPARFCDLGRPGKAFGAAGWEHFVRNRHGAINILQQKAFSRHRDTQNPPTLLNTHLSYSQELWSVLNILFTVSALYWRPETYVSRRE